MSIDVPSPPATPDFRFYPPGPGIERATPGARWVRLRWTDGAEARFHDVWLRDNTADAASIDAHSRERRFDILDIPPALSPAGVGVDARGALVIDWGDRESVYHPGWLRAYAYGLGASDARPPAYETRDAGMAARLPTFDAGEISTSAAVRLTWQQAIRCHGIALVAARPVDPAEYIEWLESLLLIRDMNWGKHFDVVYQADGKYISNKAVDIPPHNDAATRPQMPGIQIFHCVENTVEGGESCWVDGFHVAELLRRESPRDFELLSTVPWAMANRSGDSEYFCRAPFIGLDANGDLHEIRHTHWLREPLLADFDLVEPLYAAYRRYVEMTRDPRNRLEHRLCPGEVSFIDNPRVFHARGPYVTGIGERRRSRLKNHSSCRRKSASISMAECFRPGEARTGTREPCRRRKASPWLRLVRTMPPAENRSHCAPGQYTGRRCPFQRRDK